MRSLRKKGIALIMVVSTLGIMCLLGVSFLLSTQMETKAGKNYAHNVKTEYLAEAGIARGIAELRSGSEGAAGNAVDTLTEGWNAGYSDGTLLGGRGYYSVTAIDCASQLNIHNTSNTNLLQILRNLNTVLGSPLTNDECADVISNGPYAVKEEIGIKAGLTDAKYNAIKNYITIYGWEDPDVINPHTSVPYSAQSRSPININTVSAELLTAVLMGLSDGTNDINNIEAADLAAYIIAGRPYSTWDGVWNRLVSAEPAVIVDGDAAVVAANFNPNTDIMRINPNYSWRYKHNSRSAINTLDAVTGVDKTSLTVNTTELCFSSGGYYELNSTGEIRNSIGGALSQSRISAVVKVFDIWRQTTQAQFELGDFSAPAGGEGATGTNGRSIQSYPEPQHGSYPSNAHYDGQLMLAVNTTANTGGAMGMRASFDDDLDADSGGGTLQELESANDDARVIDTPNRSDLMPDGHLTVRNGDLQSCLSYNEVNKVNNKRGTVEMWLKPAFNNAILRNPDYTSRQFFSIASAAIPGQPPIGEQNGGGFLASYLFSHYNYNTIQWRFHIRGYRKEICIKGDPLGDGYLVWRGVWKGSRRELPDGWESGTWHHFAVTWEYMEDRDETVLVLYIDGYPQVSSSYKPSEWAPKYAAYPGLFNNTNFVIGYDSGEFPNNISSTRADSTIDEVRIYDYAKGSGGILLDWGNGVYYDSPDASSEASYISPFINVGSSVLGSISWTEHIPGNIAGADIVFDIHDGSSWRPVSATNPSGVGLNIVPNGLVRYRAYFRESDTGLYDTMVLDDVTITYLSKSQILYWRRI
ncbi:MAG: LamG-like jellyroll fold domain-containing protein [Candidatus Omnitrophota bacterium]